MKFNLKLKKSKNIFSQDEHINSLNNTSENATKNVQLLNGINNDERLTKDKVSTVQFLTEMVLNKMTSGELEEQQSRFQISSNIFMSEKTIKRILFIKELPMLIKPGFFESMRELLLANLTTEQRKKVELELIIHSIPNKINFRDKKISRRESVFRSELIQLIKKEAKINNAINSGSPMYRDRSDLEDLVDEITRLNRKIESFNQIQQSQMQGKETTNSFLFIEVSSPDKSICNGILSNTKQYLKSKNFKIEEIEPEDYYKQFGLANLSYEESPILDIGPITLPTNITSAIENYTQGIVRGENGDIYVGHDIDVNYPVYVSFSSSDFNQNVLIVAESGSGKTTLTKSMILFGLNHLYKNKEGYKIPSYNFLITDFKGGEYSVFSDYIKNCEVLSLGVANPKFINTLKIPDHEKYKIEKPKDAFNLSFKATHRMLATLAGVSNPRNNHTKIENICNDIIENLYLKNGVDISDPRTYHYSNDIEYQSEMWSSIKRITSEDKGMITRHGLENLNQVKIALEPYFMPGGSKNYMFSRSIDIDTLMDLKIVIFDIGTQTIGGSQTLLDNEIQAYMFQKNYFSSIYSAYKKLNNEFTIDIDEEIQRQVNNPLLSIDINDKLSGGRSSNRLTILLTNSISQLFSDMNPNAKSFKDNISSVMIGKCKPDIGRQLVDYFELYSMKDRINDITIGTGRYQHSYLTALKDKNGFIMAVTKVYLPQNIMTKLMSSRTVE